MATLKDFTVQELTDELTRRKTQIEIDILDLHAALKAWIWLKG
jgi:hypothetical protein